MKVPVDDENKRSGQGGLPPMAFMVVVLGMLVFEHTSVYRASTMGGRLSLAGIHVLVLLVMWLVLEAIIRSRDA